MHRRLDLTKGSKKNLVYREGNKSFRLTDQSMSVDYTRINSLCLRETRNVRQRKKNEFLKRFSSASNNAFVLLYFHFPPSSSSASFHCFLWQMKCYTKRNFFLFFFYPWYKLKTIYYPFKCNIFLTWCSNDGQRFRRKVPRARNLFFF